MKKKVIIMALFAAVSVYSIPEYAFASEIYETNYSTEQLLEGSDALDNYIEELEIVTISVRENDNKLVVGCRNLTEEKENKIKESQLMLSSIK